jgi:hypothetical protein
MRNEYTTSTKKLSFRTRYEEKLSLERSEKSFSRDKFGVKDFSSPQHIVRRSLSK